ncbi:MAG: FGGY family carbohydrate kinase, partial [Rhizomicrobium sp.]
MVHCLALDFGASSIRVVDIALEGGRLCQHELARLANGPVSHGGHLIWDYPKIFSWLERTLCTAGACGVSYASVGADSWGVDYVLLDGAGQVIGAPVSYRDPRSAGQIDKIAAYIPPAGLYAATGIANLSFNTLYQLAAQAESTPQDLQQAARLLFTADYVHYWLSGVAANERTLASTSQMLGLDGAWQTSLLRHLGLPDRVLPSLVAPGTALGPVRSSFGLSAQVIAPASHDTQSAILAVPAVGDDWAYLSSGTWSILGVESPVPFTGPAALAAGIGNEAGFGGTFCVQSTVTGLWLVQEISRQLGGADIASLALAAAEATPMRSVINPADARFLAPPDMIVEIRMAARETGEAVPQTPAELVRCAYDSLALFYRSKIAELSA